MADIYYNGNIISMKSEGDFIDSVCVENGIISRTGTFEGFVDNNRYIDLEGRTMLPGFIDSHSHISAVARFSSFADLFECEGFSDIQDVMKDHINSINEGLPAIGFGYDNNYLKENKHPSGSVLSRVSSDIPILIIHISGHMGCANKAAFDRCNMEYPKNGYIEEMVLEKLRDTLLLDMNMDMNDLMKKAAGTYAANGMTTVQEGGQFKDDVNTLASIGNIPFDVVGYIRVEEDIEGIYSEYSEYTSGYRNRYRIGGHKLLLDGSPQGKTAWLTKPYEGETEYSGRPWYSDAKVRQYLMDAVSKGRQILVHCNGDAAADQFISIYSGLRNFADIRPVMLHCQTVRYDQLDAMKELGIIPSIFVSHVYYWGDVHMKNLGKERGFVISPAASAFDKGLKVTFHQDSPTVKPSMLHTIWAAVNRKSRTGEIIGESERVSPYQALEAVTKNPAYQYFEKNEKGTIEEGKKADFVILDKNPLEGNLDGITVLETIKEGKSIFTGYSI